MSESARWVGLVVNAHARADSTRDAQSRTDALAALSELAARSSVPGANAQDLDETRQDLFGRAAELALALGKPAEAKRLAESGLALDPPAGPFRIQLYFALSESQRALGDAFGAATTLDRARERLRVP